MKLIFRNPKDYLYIDYLINPIPGLAILLMALNDHYLKYQFGGTLTGKLSDFCGMFYFPLLLCAAYTLVINFYFKQRKQPLTYLNRTMMYVATGISAALMLAVKLNADFNQQLVLLLNKLGFINQIVQDPTDLISLIMLPLSFWYAQQFFTTLPLKSENSKSNKQLS